MADPTNNDILDELSAEERAELERRKRAGKPTLDEEITRKYDPGRLSKLVVHGAGRGESLDLATRSDMERLHPGHDFSHVRVFRGSFAEEITARHQADAVTIANTGMIMFRESGRSAPGTTAGRALLAHELTHVAQAQKGMHFAKESGGDDSDHEVEARAVEHSVAHGKSESEGDSPASIEKDQARRRIVRDRVLELIEEEHRQQYDRTGNGEWNE